MTLYACRLFAAYQKNPGFGFPMTRFGLRPFLVSCLFLFVVSAASAADMGIGKSMEEQLFDAARLFSIYDFESHPDPLLNRDRDGNHLPDFWEPIRGEGYPDYAWERVRIVDDPFRAGLIAGQPGRVLQMPFSGEKVAWRTRIPRIIDPKLAYEISCHIRTKALNGGNAGVDIIWMHVDEHGEEEILGAPERLMAPQGQEDWTEAPLTRRVNDLNPRTNRVRFVCWVEDDPNTPNADRHAMAWFDDIRIESRPKIHFSGNFRDDDQPILLTLTYQGLTENLSAEESTDGNRKEYYRRVDIRDINNNPVPGQVKGWMRLAPGMSLSSIEMLSPELPKFGVYYITVTLFGRNREPQASVQQVIGRMKPPYRSVGLGNKERKILDRFSVEFNPRLWDKQEPKNLYYLFDLTGICRASLDLWLDYEPGRQGEASFSHPALVQALRQLRSRGLRFTGTLGQPPSELTPSGESMLDIMTTRIEPLKKHLQSVATEFAPQVNGWQWGADTAIGFDADFDPELLSPAREALRNMANAFVQVLPITLRTARALPDPRASEALNFFVDAGISENEMLERMAQLLPYLYARMNQPEPPVYPSRFLRRLIATYAKDIDLRRTEMQETTRRQHWLTIEPLPVDPHLRDRDTERAQLIGIVRKALAGRALGFDRISLGKLADPQRGLVGMTRTGELIPRPSLLAARTITEYLSDTEYIGSFQLGDEVPNFVFRRGDKAIMGLWYTGSDPYSLVEIGQGGDMRQLDIFGNATPLPRDTRVLLNDMPILIDNITLPWAMTRMSIRIEPSPQLSSVSRMQQQQLTIRNFFPDPLDGKIRMIYALSIDKENDRQLERGWLTQPGEVPVFLPGLADAGQKVEYKFSFDVRPPQAAVLGEKLVRLQARLSAGGVYHFNLDRYTTLDSDISAAYRVIESQEPGVRFIRLLGTWSPNLKENPPPLLKMQPFYQIEGDPTSFEGEVELRPGTPFVRELRIPIPRLRSKRVWVGLLEDGGMRFIRLELDKKDMYEP